MRAPAGRFALCVSLALSFAAVACGSSSPGVSGGASTHDDGGGVAPTPDAGADSGTTPPPEDAGASTPDAGDDSASTPDAGPAPGKDAGKDAQAPPNTTRLIGYLPNYNGSYADWAGKLNFSKMTHLNLAFGDVPTCAAKPCTAQDDMTFSTGDDQDIPAIVSAAHAKGVKVLISIGGGGGDQSIIQFFQAGLSTQLVASLDTFVSANDLDGVDIDCEDPSSMGAPYATFVSAVVSHFRPKGKLITAAMAQWIQSGVPSSALKQFDFVNIMTYSNLTDSQNDMTYYSGLGVPKNQIVLGVKFFGDVQDTNDDEPEYSDILNHYPNAWQSDSVSGDGSYYGGDTINYVGEATMAKETKLGAQYGGIMIWELTGDAPAPHSLLSIVQSNL